MNRVAKAGNGDPTPVTGGVGVPPFLLRKVVPALPVGEEPLAEHILRLLSLHPDLSLNFRADSISALDKQDKEALLEDLNAALGITPFKTS